MKTKKRQRRIAKNAITPQIVEAFKAFHDLQGAVDACADAGAKAYQHAQKTGDFREYHRLLARKCKPTCPCAELDSAKLVLRQSLGSGLPWGAVDVLAVRANSEWGNQLMQPALRHGKVTTVTFTSGMTRDELEQSAELRKELLAAAEMDELLEWISNERRFTDRKVQ